MKCKVLSIVALKFIGNVEYFVGEMSVAHIRGKGGTVRQAALIAK